MLGGKRHAVFDVFRVQGGMLREHWDAIQPNISLPDNSDVMFDGPVGQADLDRTEANKQLVRKFYEEVMVTSDYARMADYFENDTCIQHDPLIPAAVSELRAQLEKLANDGTPFRYEKVVRVLGRGNFVLVQSRGGYATEPAVLYDLLRVENGKLVEHWMVGQPIPVESRNSNGMLPD
jgi:predicted SnoaL-like aldol condensation-catalyzing enzyme